ncbi:MAG: hypothetical protein QXS92_00650 [Thermofilum sp.]
MTAEHASLTEQMGRVIPLKLRALGDLARLVGSTMTMGHPSYLIHFAEQGKHVYGVFIVFRDYYRLYGVPMFYYVISEKELPGNYLLYRSDESGEYVEVSKGIKPGYVAVPIGKLREKPQLLDWLEVEAE